MAAIIHKKTSDNSKVKDETNDKISSAIVILRQLLLGKNNISRASWLITCWLPEINS